MKKRSKLRVGDWVEVRSKEEILRTLDSHAQLDGMPFMPEMFRFCGKRFQVHKRAHKTCDPELRSRRIDQAVHLETRCDGQGHGGCQAGCSFFWKEEWLKPVSRSTPDKAAPPVEPRYEIDNTSSSVRCTEADVFFAVRVFDSDGKDPTYVCQATRVPFAATPLKWWDIRQYLEDYSSGNIGLTRLFSGFAYSIYYNLSQAGIGLGPVMRWLYQMARPLWRGTAWPRKSGAIPEGQPTPTATLNLQPGELVRVKPHEDILQTINADSRNRGLWWDAELVPYCGKTYRVLDRVTKIIDEKTGKMVEMKNPSIILDTVVCEARYSACRMFCPRGTYAYWREIWLERAAPQVSSGGTVSSLSATQSGVAPGVR